MSNIDTVKHLIKLVEAKKVAEFLTCFTDDAEYRFANYPAAFGSRAIEAAVNDGPFSQLKAIAMNLKYIQAKGDMVACELELDCRLADGSALTLPCLDVFRFSGDKIESMRVFMDPSPLLA